jgi:hypothetical protein
MRSVNRSFGRCWLALAAGPWLLAGAQAQTAPGTVVYRCPGNVYTDAISAKEAKDRDCRTIEGAPVTVIQAPRPRTAQAVPPAAAASPARPADSRVDPNDQRARDRERRPILEDELRRAEQALAELQREYNKGEPERRGDERNYQKYLDRVAEMKAAIARKESDVAAIKRELAKLPQ